MPYRQTVKEGITQRNVHGKVPSIPNYTTINRRVNRLDVKINDNKNKDFEDKYIVIAIDRQYGNKGYKQRSMDEERQMECNQQ